MIQILKELLSGHKHHWGTPVSRGNGEVTVTCYECSKTKVMVYREELV